MLIALLTAGGGFLLLALIAPLRRSGRPAAFLSIAGALTSFGAAVMGVARVGAASGADSTPSGRGCPTAQGALASVGVLADEQSTSMLLLVTLVALLVQIYSLGYLSDEPAPRSAGTTCISRCSRFR